MRFLNKYPKFIKFICVSAISGCTGWVYYQIKKTEEIIAARLDTSVLSISERPRPFTALDENFVVLGLTSDVEKREWSLDTTWDTMKFAFAKRLLILAKNDNKFIRKKAVRQLAKLKTLHDWHYSLLSEMIDAKAAVGLARTSNVDSRLFAEPPLHFIQHSQTMLVDLMKELLYKLDAKSQHPCMTYFISRVFVDFHDVGRFSDMDSAPLELKKYIQNSQELLPICLESLLHHASVGNYAKDIAEMQGLPLLMEIYNRFKDNIQVTATICRIISYLSMHNELLDDLFKTGWIGVLAKWVNHDDVRISIPANKALANLDFDEEPLYLQRLYPLHPNTRTLRGTDVDVVFIHGLLGGVFFTWRQRDKTKDTALGLMGKKGKRDEEPNMHQFLEDLKEYHETKTHEFEVIWEDIPTNVNEEAIGPYSSFENVMDEKMCTNCWPRDWLARDCDSLRIIGVNFETNLSMWAPICPIEKVKTLEERSEELIYQFKKVGLGQRPIIWVTHSMGGLMVKNMLCKASMSESKETKNLYLNTRGIVFYSTPHAGSSVAKFNQASALVIWPSVQVQELQENSPKLLDIHQQFLKIVDRIPLKVISFVETEPTVVTAMKFKFLVVEPHSGNPGVGEYYEIPLDHLGICKPASRHSFLYQKVLHLIKDVKSECYKTGKNL